MFKVIKDNECYLVYNANGKSTMVKGPKVCFRMFKKFERCREVSASEGEYLKIVYHDGRVEHRRNPVSIWYDPRVHLSVGKEELIKCDTHEALVVYTVNEGIASKECIDVAGEYMLEPNQRLHEFIWHGQDSNERQRFVKVAGALQFVKLWKVPDQMYLDVLKCRTSDDVLFSMRCMIFYHIVDIMEMVENSHDPIADFVSNITNDVLYQVSKLNFAEFKNSMEKFNDIKCYPRLIENSKKIGYEIDKVVYCGYQTSDSIEAMHNNAVGKRTELLLEKETQEKIEELEDMKLLKESERSEKRRYEETLKNNHEMEIETEKNDSQIKRNEALKASEAKIMENAANMESRMNRDRYEMMIENGVDITKYLISENYRMPDKVYRLEESK